MGYWVGSCRRNPHRDVALETFGGVGAVDQAFVEAGEQITEDAFDGDLVAVARVDAETGTLMDGVGEVRASGASEVGEHAENGTVAPSLFAGAAVGVGMQDGVGVGWRVVTRDVGVGGGKGEGAKDALD